MSELAEEVHNVQLDDRVLDRLADLICNDDDDIYYRSGAALVTLLRAAEWRVSSDLDGEGRWTWLRDRLRERRRDAPALRALLLRLADRREYLDRPLAAGRMVRALNELLVVEGLRIEPRTPRPRLVRREAGALPLDQQPPLELTANLTALVGHTQFGNLLRIRLDEARTCWEAGARLATIIMLGSLLEGVLYDIARSRHVDGPPPSDNLSELIKQATREQWLPRNILDYLKVQRDHRNLVHPRRQWLDGHTPTDASVTLSWNVVVATLNALGDARG